MPKQKLTSLIALVPALFAILFFSCENNYPHSPPNFPEGQQKPPMGPQDGGGSGSGNSSNYTRWTESEGTWYQIFTIAFYDSNNDGKGDLKGITQKLDYLNDSNSSAHAQRVSQYGECNQSLHIDGIWLTPIMLGTSYHKYDTEDYMLVDPDFITIGNTREEKLNKANNYTELRELQAECEKRGVKLIVDLAVNHSSYKHKWFLDGLDEWMIGNLGRYSSYYNIRTHSDYNAGSNGWFDISSHWYRPRDMLWNTPGWDKDIKTPDNKWVFYYGAFGPWMPDLNWENPAVMKEFDSIVKFWLTDLKLDGFRLDATKHAFEVAEWTGDMNRNIAFWSWFAEMTRKHKPDAYMVGECLGGDDEILQYHRPGMSSFALFMANDYGRIAGAVLGGNGRNFAEGVLWYSREVKNMHPQATFSAFLSNHDFDRSSNWLTEHQHRKMAAALLLLTPGTPFMYYGEEIGLFGYKLPDDRMVRGPMIFHTTDTTGRPDTQYIGGWTLGEQSLPGRPQGLPAYGGGVNEQINTTDSLLRYYIKIQNMKKRYPWIAWGKTDAANIDTDMQGIVAAFRVTDDKPDSATFGKSVVIAHNTGGGGDPNGPHGYIKVPNSKGYEASSALYNPDPQPVVQGNEPGVYWLKPYTTAIFREN